MRDPEKLRRSNRILIGIVILLLLFGVITRLQNRDTSFYLFGIEILPGAKQETVQEEAAPQEKEAPQGEELPQEEAPASDAEANTDNTDSAP